MSRTNKENVTSQPLSASAYVAVATAAAAAGIGLAFAYIHFLPRLVQSGADSRFYYILLLPWALLCATILFGVMRAYAHLTHQQLGTRLELGGSAALFGAVVVGGFWLVPSSETFTLTVRAFSHDEPRITRGQVTIQIEDFNDIRQFGDDGDATFKGMPHRYLGKQMKVFPKVSGYSEALQTPNVQTVVELELVLPSTHIAGRIIPPDGFKVSDLSVFAGNDEVRGTIDIDGQFDIPLHATGTIAVKVYHGRELLYDRNHLIPGPVRIDLTGMVRNGSH